MAKEQPTQKFTDLPFREQLAVVNLFTKTYGVSAVDMKWFWDVDATQPDKLIILDALKNALDEAFGQWCFYCGCRSLEFHSQLDGVEGEYYECSYCGCMQP